MPFQSGTAALLPVGASAQGEAHGSIALPATEALLDALPVALALFDADDALLFANRAACELLGVSPSLVVPGQHAATLHSMFAPMLTAIEPLVRAARAGMLAPPSVARFHSSRGHQVVEVSVRAMANGSLLVSATDITARESLLEALERRARELTAIFEVSSSSVRVLDTAGNIIRANSNALREHVGDRPRTLDELVEREQPLYPTTREPLRADLHPGHRALRGELIRGERYIVVRGVTGERRIVEIYAAPVMNGARRVLGAVLVMRDVTEQHNLSRKLAEQVAWTAKLNERVSTEAERLDRMVDESSRELLALQELRSRERRLSAVGKLAAGVMHDVNNALNPIMAAAWLLEHHATDPAAVRDYAHRIVKAAETGAVSAARVGRFLRQEPIDAEARTLVDLSQIAHDVLQLTEPLLRQRQGTDRRIECQRALGTDVLVHGVSAEMREATLNLVQNAIDAMPEGGTLTLRTLTRDDTSYLEVADTGVGMTDDVRDRAFEPFYSTKGAHGSGLGLSEVYGIMRRHRGAVDIRSAPDAGTCVSLSVPRAVRCTSEPEARAPLSSAPKRVLLVEDHADGREFMRRVLCEVGHTVVAVNSCEAARAQLSDPHATSFDLVLTDIGLPDGSGWELLQLVRSTHPSMHVGVITGWEPTISGTGTHAADFVLRKPLRAAELLSSLARLTTSLDPEPTT